MLKPIFVAGLPLVGKSYVISIIEELLKDKVKIENISNIEDRDTDTRDSYLDKNRKVYKLLSRLCTRNGILPIFELDVTEGNSWRKNVPLQLKRLLSGESALIICVSDFPSILSRDFKCFYFDRLSNHNTTKLPVLEVSGPIEWELYNPRLHNDIRGDCNELLVLNTSTYNKNLKAELSTFITNLELGI